MALANLKSAYSFYTKSAPGFKPNASVNDTDFQYKDDLTAVAVEAGFTNYGSLIRFRNRKSLNEFRLADQGTATRIRQLGTGTKFPIGPKGQVHDFDIARGGFSIKNRYEDNYGPLSNAGLADTYTKDSPIDDVYNIVKVRDVASRRLYAKEPFILRGIQKDGSSDPQRFGPTISADLPRGGVLTATNRMALDVARIGKFMITPKGLLFNIKQFGQQLMNPNVEGVNGKIGKIFNPNSTKLYTPINLMANVAGGYLGLRSRRHGLLPGNLSGGPSNDFAPGKYEDVINARSGINIINHNRLIRIHNELGTGYNPVTFEATDDERANKYSKINSLTGKLQGRMPKIAKFIQSKVFPNGVINTLSGLTGPKSIGGLGVTNITTTSITTSVPEIDPGTGHLPSATVVKTANFRNEETARLKDSGVVKLSDVKGFDGVGLEPLNSTDTAEKAKNTNNLEPGNIKAYKTLAYGNIPKRDGSRKHLDFRTGEEYNKAKIPLSKFVDTSKDKLIDDITGIGTNLDHSEDLIKFSVSNRSLGETARLLCYLTSFSDQLGQDVELVDVSGFGDEEEGATQSPITRTVAISLIVAARNPEELAYIYDNLDKLRYITSVANFASERSRLTLGNLVNNLECYLISINTNWDTEYVFDMDNKVPYVLEIDLDFTIPEVSLNYDLAYRG